MTLRNATLVATRWTTAATLARAGLQLLQIAVLARLLLPADFGLMAMAGVALAVASLLVDLGLGSALMHFPRPDRITLSTLYWLNLGLGCLLALLFALLSWPVARLYGQMELQPILVLLALVFPFSALGLPFRVLAEKDLRFQSLAQNEIVAAASGFLVALAMAASGSGIYALVGAALVTAAVGSLLAWARLSDGLRPEASFRPALAKPYLAFGLHRVGDGVWNALRMQLDVLIAGLVAGPAMVAHYAVPREQCLKVANAVINPVITRVGLPVMTQIRHDHAALRSIYLKTLRITASFNFPIYALLALFSEDVVDLLLGKQWEDAASYMRIFAVWGLIRSTGNPSGSLLYAVGMAKRAHLWNMVLFFASVFVLWLGAELGGLPGLAWTMIVSYAIVFCAAWRYLVRPACGASFGEYNFSLAPPFLTTLLAASLSAATAAMVPDAWRLAVGTTVFGIAYLLLSWRINREWLRLLLEFFEPLQRLWSSKRPGHNTNPP